MKSQAPISLLLLDVDGVITDGTLSWSAQGEERKSFSMRDVDSVFEARRSGVAIGLVTGEESEWVDSLARRLGVDSLVKGAKEKLPAVRHLAAAAGVGLHAVCYVGDSDRDAPALAAVGLGLAPMDASAGARCAARFVLAAPGGRGAVAEAVRLVLESRRNVETASADHHGTHPADFRGTLEAIRSTFEATITIQREVADALAPVIAKLALAITRVLLGGGKVLACGNGGSAADAEHLAAELVGRFEHQRAGLPAVALSANTAVLTAVGNDFGQDQLFSRQLEALGRPGDLLLAISTSGRSPNVVAAARRGRELGIEVTALAGADGGALAELTSLCVCVPSASTARIQESHRVILHALCALVEAFVLEGSGRRVPEP